MSGPSRSGAKPATVSSPFAGKQRGSAQEAHGTAPGVNGLKRMVMILLSLKVKQRVPYIELRLFCEGGV